MGKRISHSPGLPSKSQYAKDPSARCTAPKTNAQGISGLAQSEDKHTCVGHTPDLFENSSTPVGVIGLDGRRGEPAVIRATPEGACIGDRSVAWSEFADALKASPVGTVVEFAAGVYRQPLVLDGVRGMTLRGETGTVFDGGIPRLPDAELENLVKHPDGSVTWTELYPPHGGAAMIDIFNCKNVVIENLEVKNHWPNGIRIKSSQNVEIKAVAFEAGTNAISARGSTTKGISIERCTWNQDPTGKVWDSFDWQHIHHGKHNHLNGAFFQAKNIAGDVSIRDNTLRNAYNAIRIKNTGDAPVKNIRIDGNRFFNIADNAIEPEDGPHCDWSICNNHFEGFHGPISMDGVLGSGFRIEGNRFVATKLPRSAMTETPSDLNRHDNADGSARFFKVDTDGREDGLPAIKKLLIANNHFVTSSYGIRISDSPNPDRPFPPGTSFGKGTTDFFDSNTVEDRLGVFKQRD